MITPNTSEPTHASLGHLPLQEWYEQTSAADLQKTVPKALAYGSKGEDLIAIGRDMAEIGGMKTPEGVSDDQWWAELGCHFYLRGKLARASEAFRNGRLPSADTYFDESIYAMIARRVRESGHWG